MMLITVISLIFWKIANKLYLVCSLEAVYLTTLVSVGVSKQTNIFQLINWKNECFENIIIRTTITTLGIST